MFSISVLIGFEAAKRAIAYLKVIKIKDQESRFRLKLLAHQKQNYAVAKKE